MASKEKQVDAVEALVRTASDPGNSEAERHRAFGRLVARFQDRAWGYAYALLGDATLAEEAAQEAFISAWQNLAQLRDAGAFSGWLKRIVETRCQRISEQHCRRQSLPLTAALPISAPESDLPSERVLRAEQQARVREAIAQLPEQERTAIILFHLGDYSRQEVADFLGISLIAVKKRLARGRTGLKERLLLTMHDLHDLRPSHNGNFAAQVLAFTKLFSAFVDSGVSLTATLDRLAEQEPDADFRAAIRRIRDDIVAGMVLSQAMGKYPQFFSERYLAAIRDGEISGELEVALNRLAGSEVV